MSGTASWLRVIQCVYYSDLPLRISWSLMAFRCVSTFAPSPDSFSRIHSFVGAGCWYMTENWDCNRILDKPQLFHTPVCSGASGGKCGAPLTTSTSTPPARIVISIKHPTRRAKWLEIGPSFIIFPFFFCFFLHVYAASFHTYPSAARKITCVVWSPTQALRSRWFCYLGPAPSASFPPVTRMQFLPCLNKKHCCVMLCTIYACQSAWYSSEYNATQSHMFVWKQPMILSAVWVWFISSFFFLFFFSFPVTHGERSIPALSLSLSLLGPELSLRLMTGEGLGHLGVH